MPYLRTALVAPILFGAVLLAAQQASVRATEPLPVVPMPPDRADDSYRIYSLLMPVGEQGDKNSARKLLLLADATIALVPPDQPCIPQKVQDPSSMNPHIAVHPPSDRTQDFAELLADFDLRCHERVRLISEPFQLPVPVLLLDRSQQTEFVSIHGDQPDAALVARYSGASSLSSFSQVYFNAHHTVALVYAHAWCGLNCAQSFWVALELNDGVWNDLKWNSTRLRS